MRAQQVEKKTWIDLYDDTTFEVERIKTLVNLSFKLLLENGATAYQEVLCSLALEHLTNLEINNRSLCDAVEALGKQRLAHGGKA